MREDGKSNKLGILFSITLAVNLIESFLFPFLILADIAVGFSSIALMWVLLIFEFAVWCATAITANIIAGSNPKKLWCAVVAPLVAILPALIFEFSSAADLWLMILIAVGLGLIFF